MLNYDINSFALVFALPYVFIVNVTYFNFMAVRQSLNFHNL